MQIDALLSEQLTDPEFKAVYEAEGGKLSIAVALGQAREAAGLTKKALAKEADVPQSTITRIEQGDNTTIATLSKLAFALDRQLSIEFTPNDLDNITTETVTD